MKILVLLFAASLSLFAEGPQGEKWPPDGVAEVRAYVYDGTKGDLILQDEKLHSSVKNPKGALLDKDQVKRLYAALNHYDPKIQSSRCFTPRNAFVFYDKKKVIVAAVSICFDCRGLRLQPPPLFPGNDFRTFADLFEELKLPVGHFESAAAFKKLLP